jgi:protein-tyrosine phosphatase
MIAGTKKLLRENRPLRLIVFISLAVLLLGSVAAIAWTKTMYHFKTVDPGKVYRSGTLSNFALEVTRKFHGIKTIVNLRTEREMKDDWYTREKAFVEANGMQMVDIPMPPDTPPTPEQIAKFLAVATDPQMQPILVHCEMGVIRTGMMVAVYNLSILKHANEEVFKDLPWFGHTFERRPAVKEFILGYNPGYAGSN